MFTEGLAKIYTRIRENVIFKLDLNRKPRDDSNSQAPHQNISSIAASFTPTDGVSSTSTCTTLNFHQIFLRFYQTLHNQLCFSSKHANIERWIFNFLGENRLK